MDTPSNGHRIPGRDWARAIPLVTIFGMVFGAGVIFAGQRVMSNSLDELSRDLKASTAAADARLRSLEDYRLAHEAVASPLMNQYLKDLETRRKR